MSVTAQDLKNRLTGLVSYLGGLDLSQRGVLIEDCHADAMNKVYSILVGRGFSKTQIDTVWPRFKEFVLDIGAWLFFRRGLPNLETIPAFIFEYKKREEHLRILKMVDANGVPIPPETRQVDIDAQEPFFDYNDRQW